MELINTAGVLKSPTSMSFKRFLWKDSCYRSQQEDAVLYYALMFLIVGLIAGALGIYGVAAVASQIAWVLFLIGVILLVVHVVTGSRPRSAL